MPVRRGAGHVEAVVLAGGLGSRLRPAVSDRPKPMAEVARRPFLEWLLLALREQGVGRVVVCTGYLADVIEGYFGPGDAWGLDITYSREPAPLGTAGALREALDRIESVRFLVVNGDSYCPLDVSRLLTAHQELGARATIWVVPGAGQNRFGSVDVDATGAVRGFREKSSGGLGLVSAGVYALERGVVESMPRRRPLSLEAEVFPSLVSKGLCAVVGQGPLLDIGTPESYRRACPILERQLRHLGSGPR